MTIPLGAPHSGNSSGADAQQSSSWASWLIIGVAIAAVVILGVTLTTRVMNPTPTSAPTAVATGSMTADVRIEGMAYIPNRIEVPPGTQLTIQLTNDDNQRHDLTLNGVTTPLIDPGDTVTLDAGVFTDNTQGYCTVAGHKSQGMVFDVVVTGSAVSAAEAPATDSLVEVPSSAERLSHEITDAIWRDPELDPAPTGTVHDVEMTVTEEIREVAPGHRQLQWLFNGQAPGPTLRGKVGDTFRITLKNEGSMGHSVDFHAGEVSPDAPMSTINPGESLVYEFVARRYGIWMYHCATAPMSLHIANGMAGAVIIDPPEGLDTVDSEYALVASEVFLGAEATGADADRVTAGSYDLTAFNGFPNQYDGRPIELKVGQRARFWVLNVGPDNPLAFHIVGTVFDTVFTEGQYTIRHGLDQDTGAQVLPLLPAQGGFVEVTFDEPGSYTFVNHLMTDAEKGQHGTIKVS